MLHKTITDRSIRSRALKSPVSCIKLQRAAFLFAHVYHLMQTAAVSFVRQDSLSKCTSHIRFESTFHPAFTCITFISVRHKLNFINSLDTARFRTWETLYRKRES